MSFRTGLIVLTLVVLGLMAVYLVWRLVSVRRNPTTKDPENLTPFLDDEGLEGPRLERALGWSPAVAAEEGIRRMVEWTQSHG